MVDLKSSEQLSLHAYADNHGFLTIGYGHCVDSRRNGGITEIQAQELLVTDIGNAMNLLDEYYSWWTRKSDNIRRVMVNMVFHLGLSEFNKLKKFHSALKRGDYEEATCEMEHAGGRVQALKHLVEAEGS
ncbi:MAG: glycoside hydrolase family protein [Nitrososphaerales archaeon]